MTRPSKAKTPLLAGLVVAAGLLAAELAGVLPGGAAAESEETGLRQEYLAAAAQEQQEQQLIRQAGAWRAAMTEAGKQWSELRRTLIAAPTLDLAQSTLRDLVQQRITDMKRIASPRFTYIPEAGEPASRIRPISLRVDFDATSHAEAYAALDRIENMSGVLVSLASIRIEGPGRAQMPEQITVSATVRALALVGEGAG